MSSVVSSETGGWLLLVCYVCHYIISNFEKKNIANQLAIEQKHFLSQAGAMPQLTGNAMKASGCLG